MVLYFLHGLYYSLHHVSGRIAAQIFMRHAAINEYLEKKIIVYCIVMCNSFTTWKS